MLDLNRLYRHKRIENWNNARDAASSWVCGGADVEPLPGEQMQPQSSRPTASAASNRDGYRVRMTSCDRAESTIRGRFAGDQECMVVRSSVRLLILVGVLWLMAAVGLGVPAAQASSGQNAASSESLGVGSSGMELLTGVDERREAEEAALASPEAVAERERSRTEFAGYGRNAAVALAERVFEIQTAASKQAGSDQALRRSRPDSDTPSPAAG